MLDTAEQMYRYFLAEVRKERTVVITPDQWTEFINPIVLDWAKTKLPELEFNQKRIDDLEAIKALTDGVQYQYIHSVENRYNYWDIPYESPDHPKYLHGISVNFTWKFLPDSTTPGGGNEGTSPLATTELEWNPKPLTRPSWVTYSDEEKARERVYRYGKPYRSDVRYTNMDNPYRHDTGSWVYFEQRGGRIKISSTRPDVFNLMQLEYYHYPKTITFSSTIDNPGSFASTQNKEIMDMAVTRYLEKVSDPRIQTQPQVQGAIPK